MARTLPLVCSITPAYTLPLLVALASLTAWLRPDRRVVLHLVHAGLPDDHLAAIETLAEVRPIGLDGDLLASIPAHGRFPREAAVPIVLGDLLPEHVDRVVFLDADTLVLDDPEELWRLDLGARALGAVVDAAIPLCSSPRGVRDWQARGIPAAAPYFNAGVMTISLRAWREREVGDRAMRYLVDVPGGRHFLHQEALNAVAWDEWLPLDGRWNLLGGFVGRRHGPALGGMQPGIVHFAGRVKPWRGRVPGPFDVPYRAVLAQVAPLLPPVATTIRDRALGAYDRRLRGRLFPLERALWTRGLIR